MTVLLALAAVALFAGVQAGKRTYFPGFTNFACEVVDSVEKEVIWAQGACPGKSACKLGPFEVPFGKWDVSILVTFCDNLDENGYYDVLSQACKIVLEDGSIPLDFTDVLWEKCDIGPFNTVYNGVGAEVYFTKQKFNPYLRKGWRKIMKKIEEKNKEARKNKKNGEKNDEDEEEDEEQMGGKPENKESKSEAQRKRKGKQGGQGQGEGGKRKSKKSKKSRQEGGNENDEGEEEDQEEQGEKKRCSRKHHKKRKGGRRKKGN